MLAAGTYRVASLHLKHVDQRSSRFRFGELRVIGLSLVCMIVHVWGSHGSVIHRLVTLQIVRWTSMVLGCIRRVFLRTELFHSRTRLALQICYGPRPGQGVPLFRPSHRMVFYLRRLLVQLYAAPSRAPLTAGRRDGHIFPWVTYSRPLQRLIQRLHYLHAAANVAFLAGLRRTTVLSLFMASTPVGAKTRFLI